MTSDMTPDMTSAEPSQVSHVLRQHWTRFLALGLVLILFGLVALADLFVATVASVFYIGMLMLIGGIAHVLHAFRMKGWDQFLIWLLSGLLYTAAGILAFTNPAQTAVALTLLMAIALVVAGLVRIWLGLRLRPAKGSGLVLAGGIITALAGFAIALGWPVNSLVILGFFLAVDLLFQGVSLVALALAARSA